MPCGLADQLVEFDERVRAHAERFEIQARRVLLEQTQHRALAVPGRQRRDPHVDRPAAHAQRDPAILRQTLFGDIELRHDLDPRDQCAVQRLLRPHDIAQRAVDAKAHHRRILERLDVNIRSLFARRLREQRVDHADDRRVVFRFEQILDLGNLLHQTRQIDFAFHFADHLRRAAILARVRLVDRLREFVSRQTHHRQRAEIARHFGERGIAGAFADPDFQAVGVLMRDQNLAAAGKAIGHEPRGDRRRRAALGMLRRDRGRNRRLATPARVAADDAEPDGGVDGVLTAALLAPWWTGAPVAQDWSGQRRRS